MTRTIVTAAILFVTGGLTLLDLYAWLTPEPRDTISKIVYDAFESHPSIACIVGAMVGHLSCTIYCSTTYLYVASAVTTLIHISLLVLDFKFGLLPSLPPVIYVMLFVLVGCIGIPQRM